MDVVAPPTRRAAVATLVSTAGSSPKEAGAKMWVDETGAIVGSVTIGGCVDARVIEETQAVLAARAPRLIAMDLGDEDAWALGMTCAGTVEVFIEPYEPSLDTDPVARTLAIASREVAAGRSMAIVVPIAGASGRLLVRQTGQRSGTLGDPTIDAAAAATAIEALNAGKSRSVTLPLPTGEVRIFVDVHAPPLSLTVFGATHVAMALVELAKATGIRTTVVDGRDRFATRERFPKADDLIVGMPSEIAARLTLNAQSLVVLLSHDYKYDLPVLRAVLASEAAYIGCLGSARRGKAMIEFLGAEGVPLEQLARLRIPVGLDIGARSAGEIALSVLSEALAVQRGKNGGPMRDRR